MTLEHDNREDEHKGGTEERERDRMAAEKFRETSSSSAIETRRV